MNLLRVGRHLVWYVSQLMTLLPADNIDTGTPSGVGVGFDPPRFLREGDLVEVCINVLGRLRHELVPAQVGPR